jgi:cell division protein FtsL
MKYQAFISYRHSDYSRKTAEALERALKRYAKPLLKPPIKIFRDEKHMVPGEGLSKLIREGLENSKYLLFLAEKEAAQSIWCKNELNHWCNELKRADKLIIVHIGDDIALDTENDKIDWVNTNALPSNLKQYIPTIPLYTDLSWIQKDHDADLENIRYRGIINTITAKFRGLTPEQINDEEIKAYRRNRKLRNGAILILSILLLLSSITTWWAMDRTEYAIEQAEIARQQKKEATNALIDILIQRAAVYTDSRNYNIALDELYKAKRLDSTHTKVIEKIREIEIKLNQ